MIYSTKYALANHHVEKVIGKKALTTVPILMSTFPNTAKMANIETE